MAAYPRYEYRSSARTADFDGNPWVLVVRTPSGGINFDQFLYYPLQNYPEEGYGAPSNASETGRTFTSSGVRQQSSIFRL